MAWWMLIPAALSAISSVQNRQETTAQNLSNKRWNQYNATMQYNTDLNNLISQSAITGLNVKMLMASAAATSEATNALVDFKSRQIMEISLYNDQLFEEDLKTLWEEANLDLKLIEMQRAKERGEIEVTQSASGTVMGQDSNADVIVDQMAQEAMDKFIIQRGAELKAAKINNARAQSLFLGQQQIKAIVTEGQVNNATANAQAAIQAAGMTAQNAIATNAGLKTAYNSWTSGMIGADITASDNQTSINNQFSSGMFSSIGKGFSSYMDSKQPELDAG